jgi:hypothetical protein
MRVLWQYVEPSYAMRLIEDRPEGVGYLLKERVFDIATGLRPHPLDRRREPDHPR